MRIVTARRISQVFFFALFVWLCVVSTVGERIWQIRGWEVNWFLQLDPLVAIGTVLTTHTLYKGLLWAAVTIVLTIIFGRFFCSWVCPFGSMHHFAGFLANRKKKAAQKIKLNKYRRGQCVKYFVLAVFLGMAAFPSIASSLQTGLLDPIPLVTRSFNLILLPLADKGFNFVSVTERFYEGAWLIFTVFLGAVLLNIVIPRFYCRFVCPLGALFGIIGRFALWRIGKREGECDSCKVCEKSCEGGCSPSDNTRISECVLCFNCRDDCRNELLNYQTARSADGEITNPDISRRGFVLSLASGILAVPAVRLSNKLGDNWDNTVIRPPGALAEKEFLNRCIKCGQCMRICPTNVIQPAGFSKGIEGLWTPVLNNRIGSSGCQLNCVACGQVCPSSAIRAIPLAEKLGTGEFAETGPIKLGTAFVDRGRCLPWAMDKPCIVCEENCPVSPKAIYTEEIFKTIRDGELTVKGVSGDTIELTEAIEADKSLRDKFGSGDYYCLTEDGVRKKITGNTDKTIEIDYNGKVAKGLTAGVRVFIQVRLQRPVVDIDKCIGCGVCEHECPVSGKKTIRVTAENQSRDIEKALLLKG